MVKVYKNWIDNINTEKLINYVKNCNEKKWQVKEHIPGNEFWEGRFINACDIEDKEIQQLLITNRRAIIKEMKKVYKIEKELYGDLVQFVRWPKGIELPPHADAEQQDGSPHPLAWREYASITYLNDNFEGGNIYFPTRDNLSPTIEPGMTAFFPSTLEYLHGVKAVTEGVRYTIASFYTTNKHYHDGN